MPHVISITYSCQDINYLEELEKRKL
jgi:hypothetical protein